MRLRLWAWLFPEYRLDEKFDELANLLRAESRLTEQVIVRRKDNDCGSDR